jgi:hypothetical protein
MKSKTIGGTAGISMTLSGFAAALGLCCVSPLAVTLFGVSGAITFARLGAYRPYFIVIAAVFMALAIYGAYRSRHACATDPVLRRRRMWLNVFLILGVALLTLAIFAGQLQQILQTQVLS